MFRQACLFGKICYTRCTMHAVLIPSIIWEDFGQKKMDFTLNGNLDNRFVWSLRTDHALVSVIAPVMFVLLLTQKVKVTEIIFADDRPKFIFLQRGRRSGAIHEVSLKIIATYR